MKLRHLLLMLSLMLTAASIGQFPKMDDFYFHAADVGLLQVKQVQKEIGLTEAQRASMNVFADGHRAKLAKLQKEYDDKKKPDDARNDPRLMGYLLELKTNVMARLTAPQLKRLGEISLQRVGLAALGDDKVGTKVGMSKDQVMKVRAAFQDGGRKYAAAERAVAEPILKKYTDKRVTDKKQMEEMQKKFDAEMGAAMQKAQPQLASIKAQAEKSMKAILTTAQWAKYQSLLGKAFKPA